jgi:purine/pyrimidine-nucleoside phosphorylase
VCRTLAQRTQETDSEIDGEQSHRVDLCDDVSILIRIGDASISIIVINFNLCEVFVLKHHTYFDGRVQSIGFERNGLRATVGVIAPGEYHFNTAAAERMTVTSGLLRARVPNGDWQSFPAGTYFEVPANSGFDVQAAGGAAGYLCEFLGA